MFGTYARNVISKNGRYIANDEVYEWRGRPLNYKEGQKLFGCRCKPGECNAYRSCYYTNELYWSCEAEEYLTLEEFLK